MKVDKRAPLDESDARRLGSPFRVFIKLFNNNSNLRLLCR
jgi:hypothetical protein